MITLSRSVSTALIAGLLGALSACEPPSDDHAKVADAEGRIASAEATPTACNLSGTWATKTTLEVTWPSTLGIQRGRGTIVQYIKSTRVHSGLSFTDTVEVCGLTSPDYESRPLFGGQRYGVRFPDAMFDAHALPTSAADGTLSSSESGARYALNDVLFMLGMTMNNPLTDPWPAEPRDVQTTAGPNGKPGITALAATDPGYSFPPINLTQSRRAGAFQIAIRNVGSAEGTVETCDRLTGSVTVAVINGKPTLDNHIVGCTTTLGEDCTPSERDFIDHQNPVFAPEGPGSVVSVRVRDNFTCADVRAATY